MAEDVVNDAVQVGGLATTPCVTQDLVLHGFMRRDDPDLPTDPALRVYGSDARWWMRSPVKTRAGRSRSTSAPVPRVHVVFAVRNELARTLEDVLARRTRALLLDARASIEIAPAVAALMASELGRDAAWVRAQVAEYETLAKGYLL